MKMLRAIAFGLCLGLLAACARDDLDQPPPPLGDFKLGLNITVARNIQKIPISRSATGAEWEAAMQAAIQNRFGRYNGAKFYNIGISVDAYALAPPGIPVVLKPRSLLIITANIWDDAAQKKLNPQGKQLSIFEGLSAETFIGSGLTQTREEQIARLSYRSAKAVEAWLLGQPEWFGLPALKGSRAARASEKAARQAPALPALAASPRPLPRPPRAPLPRPAP